MREKLWKKIEKVIADDPTYRMKSAMNTTVSGEPGFVIELKRTGVDMPEPKKEKPKRAPLRCKFGFHKFSKWGEAYKDFGLLSYQDRHCVLCNFVGMRLVG